MHFDTTIARNIALRLDFIENYSQRPHVMVLTAIEMECVRAAVVLAMAKVVQEEYAEPPAESRPAEPSTRDREVSDGTV